MPTMNLVLIKGSNIDSSLTRVSGEFSLPLHGIVT